MQIGSITPQSRPTRSSSSEPVSRADQAQVRELQSRDQEVRAHEAAHKAAAGDLARGGASFTYEVGPNGVRYAVGGEVSIDTSPVADDPQATLRKASRIRQAALAPATPSGQDRAVAQQAAAMAAEAQAQIAAERNSGTEEESGADATEGREPEQDRSMVENELIAGYRSSDSPPTSSMPALFA